MLVRNIWTKHCIILECNIFLLRPSFNNEKTKIFLWKVTYSNIIVSLNRYKYRFCMHFRNIYQVVGLLDIWILSDCLKLIIWIIWLSNCVFPSFNWHNYLNLAIIEDINLNIFGNRINKRRGGFGSWGRGKEKKKRRGGYGKFWLWTVSFLGLFWQHFGVYSKMQQLFFSVFLHRFPFPLFKEILLYY